MCPVLAQADDEYMISDYDLFVNKYISVPKDMGALNCAAFVAGIVKGVLDGAGFPARHVALSYAAPAQLKLQLLSACWGRDVSWLLHDSVCSLAAG